MKILYSPETPPFDNRTSDAYIGNLICQVTDHISKILDVSFLFEFLFDELAFINLNSKKWSHRVLVSASSHLLWILSNVGHIDKTSFFPCFKLKGVIGKHHEIIPRPLPCWRPQNKYHMRFWFGILVRGFELIWAKWSLW